MEPLLESQDLVKQYVTGAGAATAALQCVDLAVAPGEFVAIMGPSGCGLGGRIRLRLAAEYRQP